MGRCDAGASDLEPPRLRPAGRRVARRGVIAFALAAMAALEAAGCGTDSRPTPDSVDSGAVMDSVAVAARQALSAIQRRDPRALAEVKRLDQALLRHLRIKRAQDAEEFAAVHWKNMLFRDDLNQVEEALERRDFSLADRDFRRILVRCETCHKAYNRSYERRTGGPNPEAEEMNRTVRVLLGETGKN